MLRQDHKLDLTTVGEGCGDLVHSVLAVSEKHIGVLLEEDRVLEIRVSATHGTLAEDYLLGAPDLMQISKITILNKYYIVSTQF